MHNLMHFRMLAANLGLVLAGYPVWEGVRGLHRMLPARKTTRRRKQDFYYENRVAVPVDELETRL